MKIKQILALVFLTSVHSAYNIGRETPDDKLFRGIRSKNIMLVQQALNDGANINSRGKDRRTTPLISAIRNRSSIEIIQLLLNTEGINVNALNFPERNTAIMEVVRSYNYNRTTGYRNIIIQLLNAGADLTIENRDGETAIDLSRNEEITKILEEALKKQEEKKLKKELEELEEQRYFTQQQVNLSTPLFPGFAELVSEYAVCPKEPKKNQSQEKEDQE